MTRCIYYYRSTQCYCDVIRENTEIKYAHELIDDIAKVVAEMNEEGCQFAEDARTLIICDERDETSAKVLAELKTHDNWGYIDETMTTEERSKVVDKCENKVILATEGDLVGDTRFPVVAVLTRDFGDDIENFDDYCDDDGILIDYGFSPWYHVKTPQKCVLTKWYDFTKQLPTNFEDYIGLITLKAPEVRFVCKSDPSLADVMLDLKRDGWGGRPDPIKEIGEIVEEHERKYGTECTTYIGWVYIDETGNTAIKSFSDPDIYESLSALPSWGVDTVFRAVNVCKQANNEGWVYHPQWSKEA